MAAQPSEPQPVEPQPLGGPTFVFRTSTFRGANLWNLNLWDVRGLADRTALSAFGWTLLRQPGRPAPSIWRMLPGCPRPRPPSPRSPGRRRSRRRRTWPGTVWQCFDGSYNASRLGVGDREPAPAKEGGPVASVRERCSIGFGVPPRACRRTAAAPATEQKKGQRFWPFLFVLL